MTLSITETIRMAALALASLVLFMSPPSRVLAQEVAAIDSAAEPIAQANVADAVAEEANSPIPPVETFHRGLLQIMKDAETLGFDGRVNRLEPLMAEVFDLDFMASKTIGRQWKKLSDEDKARWAATFTKFTTANYAGRFTGYTGEEFVTLGVEDAARGTRVVLTKIIVPNGDDVQLNYRMIERGGTWRVIDVYLNGTVSELALRRSEYSSALKREGFPKLLDSVEHKIEDLKAKGQAES